MVDFFVMNGRTVNLVQSRDSLAGVKMMLAGYEILPQGVYRHIGISPSLIFGNIAAATTALTNISQLSPVSLDVVANAVGDALTDAVTNLPVNLVTIVLADVVAGLNQTNKAVNKNGANLNGVAANLNTIKKAIDVIAGDLTQLQNKVNAVLTAAAPVVTTQ